MGLSNEQKRDSITPLQVMLEIANALKTLTKGDLEKAIKTAYELPESEQKKADSARADIAKNQELLDGCIKKTQEISDSIQVLNGKQATIDQQLTLISNSRSDLQDTRLELEKQKKDLMQISDDLSKREETLTTNNSKLAQFKIDLDNRESQIANTEAELKAKADKIRNLVG